MKKKWICLVTLGLFVTMLSAQTTDVAEKWKTKDFQQANTMGGGEAAISESGKFEEIYQGKR